MPHNHISFYVHGEMGAEDTVPVELTISNRYVYSTQPHRYFNGNILSSVLMMLYAHLSHEPLLA
jgi:hypothetical protein